MTTFLFLDFDGVINNPETENRPYVWPAWHSYAGTRSIVKWVSQDLIEKVEELRSWADADVVISSTWRHHYKLDELREILAPIPSERIIGITPTSNRSFNYSSSDSTRGHEIGVYLHNNPCDRFIILDDLGPSEFLPDQRDKLIQTNDDFGIAEEDIAAAKKNLDMQAREVKVTP